MSDIVTILCVGDDPAATAVLEGTLVRMGHRPILARTASEMLQWLSRSGADLIIWDSSTPDLTAEELVVLLANQGRDIPLIVQTGREGVDRATAAVDAGAADYIEMPIHPPRVVVAVRQALASARLRRENDTLRAHLARVASRDLAPDPWMSDGGRRGVAAPRPPVPESGAVPAGTGATATAEAAAIVLHTFNVHEAERVLIQHALRATGNNRTRAAQLLGISVRTLRNKLNGRAVAALTNG